MYFGTATFASSSYPAGGGLNVCASDGTYAAGYCYTITGFANT
jgi:hypothetical protein